MGWGWWKLRFSGGGGAKVGELCWFVGGGELGLWSCECVCEWVGEGEGGTSSVTKVSRAGSYIVAGEGCSSGWWR